MSKKFLALSVSTYTLPLKNGTCLTKIPPFQNMKMAYCKGFGISERSKKAKKPRKKKIKSK